MTRSTREVIDIFNIIKRALTYPIGPTSIADPTDEQISIYAKLKGTEGLYRITIERIPDYD